MKIYKILLVSTLIILTPQITQAQITRADSQNRTNKSTKSFLGNQSINYFPGIISGVKSTAKFSGIGDLAGGNLSAAAAVSGDGSTVVGYSQNDSSQPPILWQPGGSITPLTKMEKQCAGWATDISSDGSTIVGYYDESAGGGYVGTNSFIWDGSFHDLIMEPESAWVYNNWIYNYAFGISADGSTIVGQMQLPDSFPKPFIYRGGSPQILSIPDGCREGMAVAASGDGSVIVGQAYSYTLSYAPNWFVCWDGSGEMKYANSVGTGNGFSVRGISQNGQFAVGTEPDYSRSYPIVWHTDDGAGYRLPSDCGEPNGISADGSVVVGTSKYIDSLYSTAAYVYYRHSSHYRLIKDILIKDYNLDVSGWRLNTATGVSADGSIVVGTGVNPSGDQEGWYAYIPFIDVYIPTEDALLISGRKDTIWWQSAGPKLVNIYFSADSGVTKTSIVKSYPAESGNYTWEVPDTVSDKCMIIIQGAEDSSIIGTTGPFTVRGYRLVRTKPYSNDYELYDPAVHGWQFANDPGILWPNSWWSSFNYFSGIDPYTQSPYPSRNPFTMAFASDFPDWPLFVRTFGEENCYYSTTLGWYDGSAEQFWEAQKEKWGGSCYGFAISTLLAFDMPYNFKTKFPEMPNFNAPYDQYTLAEFGCTDSIRIVINSLYFSQYGHPHKPYYDYKSAVTTPKQTLEELRQMFLYNARNDRSLSLVPKNAVGGHEVVPYRVAKDPGGPSKFRIYVHDSNIPADKDAWVLVDTAANTWSYNNLKNKYGQPWGGGKGLTLDDPVMAYLTRPSIPKTSQSAAGRKSIFLASDSTLDVYIPQAANIIFQDQLGGNLGISGDSVINEIPGGMAMRSGRIDAPPPGYTVPKGPYEVSIEKCPDSILVFKVFTDSMIYSYRRHGVDSLQNDNLEINNRGLSFGNHDGTAKNIDLDFVIPIPMNYYGECRAYLPNLMIENGDSLHVSVDNKNIYTTLTLRNLGMSRITYDVKLLTYWWQNYVGYNQGKYEHGSIILDANSSQILKPRWLNMNGNELEVDIDNNNDDIIDTTVYLSDQTTGVENHGSKEKPSAYALFQNYPNPFNPVTTIKYELPRKSIVTLRIIDVLGQVVSTLVNEEKEMGRHEVRFDASKLPSGIYFYQIQAGDFTQTRKLLFLK